MNISKPRHSKSGAFPKIFSGIQNFKELESRISELPTEQQRGDAFEIFVEAYLATNPINKAKVVWPLNTAPIKILKQLGLTLKDNGVDGLFEDYDPGYCGYQVRFRSGRKALTWTSLGTFMGQTDRVCRRLLLTNSDSISNIAGDRKDFTTIRGRDFDKLQPQAFKAIEAWLKNSPIKPERKKPRPHQLEAAKKISDELKNAGRTTALMACATGKGLVAVLVAESLQAKTILVLLPSLGLLSQTLHEWLAEHSEQNFRYLCVCSDESVDFDNDEVALKTSDLDFPVTTDTSKIRDFLRKNRTETRIIFSTYHSAQIIGMAAKNYQSFDLGIFDEAHKTAGIAGKHFGYALHNKNISILKRVFLTATWRHFNILKKDKYGNAIQVYSMDLPALYGRVCYKLTYVEAVKRKIITPFTVIISIITSDDLNRELIKLGITEIQEDVIRSIQVAHQLALKAAINKYDIKKAITFHSSVHSAASFTSEGSEGISTHLNNFQTFHVNGKMSTDYRDAILNEVRECKRAIVSNARCLIEGIDLPSVELVGFMNPRRSSSDIAQITGRTARQSEGKESGYVFLPILLNLQKGETPEEALKHTDLNHIWTTLQALQELDENLADVIKIMRQNKGAVKGYSDREFLERVQIIGPMIGIDKLRSGICARAIDILSSTWDERFGELMSFQKREGNCNVPNIYPENLGLGIWVSNQRANKNVLSPDRVQRLESIGFIWSVFSSQWDKMFTALVEFHAKNNSCNVPITYPENPPLGFWVRTQRKNKTTLSSDRLQRLNDLNFDWNPITSKWDEMFAALKKFEKQNGHCKVPKGYPDNPDLRSWVQEQRKHKNKLPSNHVKRLDSIGFDWAPYDSQWDEMSSALVEFKAENGHCNVPQKYPKNPPLGDWVSNQRTKKNNLSSDRVQKLDELGFDWDPTNSQWEKMFSALVKFEAENGHCNVPQKYPKNPPLGRWVGTQRSEKNSLSPETVRRLNTLGFDWELRRIRSGIRCSQL